MNTDSWGVFVIRLESSVTPCGGWMKWRVDEVEGGWSGGWMKWRVDGVEGG